MEPDATKNVEISGFTRRRISSILKAPRRSVRYPDPEQQENVVECAKPGEKRNSRRVSFAPANDVLLFSKDVKNTSPARSPFQDLTATAGGPTLNRGQTGDNGDGSQKIAGMESLLNAPLHDHQLKDKVNFNTGDDFGERTVMFSTHDASMDMTQSHTFNIAADALEDSAFQNNDVFPTLLDKRVLFSVDPLSTDKTHSHSASVAGASIFSFAGRKPDLCVEKKTPSASVQCLDPEFENFLASLNKPIGPSVDAAITRATPPLGLSAEDKDKENLVPPPVPAAIGKPLNQSRNSGPLPAALYPEEKVTEAQGGDDEDVDPFQWLFPSQDMYANSDRRVSQTSEITKSDRQQTRKSVGLSDLKGMGTLYNTSPSLDHLTGGEKTVRFTADDAAMDVTKSHTVNIATSFQPQLQNVAPPPTFGEKTVRFSASDAGMDMTQCLTVNIATNSSSGSLPLHQHVLPVLQNVEKTVLFSADEMFMDLTQTHTVHIACGSEAPELMSTNTLNPGFENVPARRAHADKENESRGRSVMGGDLSMNMTEARLDSFIPDTTAPVQQTAYQQSRETTGPPDYQGMGTLYSTSPSLDHLNGGEKTVRFTADDAAMDVTKSHTVNIATSFQPQLQNVAPPPTLGEKTVRFSAIDAGMDMTQCLTVNIATNSSSGSLPLHQHVLPVLHNVDVPSTVKKEESDLRKDFSILDKSLKTTPHTHHRVGADLKEEQREKTVLFSADEMFMDLTQTHTVHIACGSEAPELMSTNTLNPGFENVPVGRSQASDPARPCVIPRTTPTAAPPYSDAINTNGSLVLPKAQRVHADKEYEPLSQSRRFGRSLSGSTICPKDVGMDVTEPRGRSVMGGDLSMNMTEARLDSFIPDTTAPLQQTSYQQSRETTGPPDYQGMGIPYNTSRSVDHLTGGEKTVRFTADDAAMDVTKSHTVNIATSFQPQLQNVAPPPTLGEKTVRFSASDAGMDMTQCLAVNIATNSSSGSLPLHQHVLPVLQNVDVPSTVKKEESDVCDVHQERSVYVPELELLKAEATDKPFAPESTDMHGSPIQPPVKTPDVNAELEAPVLASGVMEKSVNEILTDCADSSAHMDLTEAQTGHIIEQTFTNQIPQCVSLTQNQDFDHSKAVKASPVRSEAPGPSFPDNVSIATLPDSPDSGEKESFRESEPTGRSGAVIQNVAGSPSVVDQDADTVNSRKSRRISLADLTSKVRRLSHMINAAPDPVATMPRSSLEHDLEKNSEVKLASAPVEPELKKVRAEDISQDQCLTTEQVSAPAATPFNLKTKQLMSRLSVGGFKPKLPQRSKPEDSTKGKLAMTVLGCPAAKVPNHLSNFDNDVSDIFDEELGSYEDTSEILDVPGDVEKVSEEKRALEEFDFRMMENDMFDEDFMSSVHRQKRRLLEDENIDNEKRMKTSTDSAVMVSLSDGADGDGNVSAAPTTTQTFESSVSSHTASTRCEATFESTYKQSFFESQLEDYASEMQMKLEDGTITVMEFFKIFNIDFVIHNPRQSVRPGRLLSETEVAAMDLLKNRHISRPKQVVYETDVRDLTDKVERLKVRMEDLDKPLKAVNNLLWEEMKHYSEKELKSFGVKLKERNNFFRKTSKAQSHEMKEVLYSKLVQAHLEEQQKLKETIEKADGMLMSLDDCIHQLQTELAGVEQNGFDDKPSMKSLQDDIAKATETLADNERKIPELEMQKKQNSSKLKRLNAEMRNLENHMDVLEILNEWKLKERGRDCTRYTFLHETMTLQLSYEKSDGNLADNESERKTTEIRFSFELDDEKSQCHARLVHKLVSQYTEGESAWVENFPTRAHVPKLLRDVGLVVSRCRLLGEECRRLKLWGSLPFDIVHFSCVDTRICIVFSSLKAFSKFQVVFAVSLINRLCVLEVESFKNMIGSTTLEQIEEIVASFTPAENLLTRIVKKIHQTLLC